MAPVIPYGAIIRIIASAGSVFRAWHAITIIVGIHLPCQHQLLVVVQTLYPLCLLLGFGQRRQQHGRQYCNDGYHHQQFDQWIDLIASSTAGNFLPSIAQNRLATIAHRMRFRYFPAHDRLLWRWRYDLFFVP